MEAKIRKNKTIRLFSIFSSISSFLFRFFKSLHPSACVFMFVWERLYEVGVSIADSAAKIMRVEGLSYGQRARSLVR